MIGIKEKTMKLMTYNEHLAIFDVDGTLIEDYKTGIHAVNDFIQIDNPYQPGQVLFKKKKNGNINLLKDSKGKGMTVVVWSMGGGKYAEEVCRQLKIEDYVDFVMPKPVKFCDDKTDLASIVGLHVFIQD